MIAWLWFITGLLFATNSFAVQPAVAIKEPVIGESVNRNLIRKLDTNIIRTAMESSFRATRKFRVLSRDKATLQAIREEQTFAQSDLTKGDAAETGNINNANYLILPTVQDFKFYRYHQALPNFEDKYQRSDDGVLVVNAQMIDTSSGQIVTTFFLKDSFTTKKQIVNDASGEPSSTYFEKMAKGIAAQLASQFVAQVYPMKIVKRLRTNELILNRGKDGGLKVGENLDVFFAGEVLIDPDTGESLGSSEEFIGKVTVTRILPKVTYAKIISEVDPDYLPMGTGNIVRKGQ